MSTKTTIVLLAIASLIVFSPHRMDAEPLHIQEATIEQHIQRIFGDKSKVATAVLKHESGFNLNAKGWNCRYGGKSKACKKEDRYRAWSVDCGIAQVNVKGQVCPSELMTLSGNMAQVEKIYKTQGLNAWVSYKTGAYKKYL